MAEGNIITPQNGYQMKALSSSADIVIGGGAAGAGKTFSLLLDPLRYIKNPDFSAVIFRRTTPQIKAPGGLWDESMKLYPIVSGKANHTYLTWEFPKGSKIKFSHLENEKNVFSWQGSQIPYIAFDELTHFSKETFFYLLSRNRSPSGIKPRVMATTNPDPDSWLHDLIQWWIGDDGYPIPERNGVVRYFTKDGDSMIWADSLQECLKKSAYFINPLAEKAGVDPKEFVKSLTFIGGNVYENQELLKANPEYLANLAAQSSDTRLQLLEGNWKVSINPDDIYNYNSFKDIFTNTFVKHGPKRITVDVAMGGVDKLIVSLFKGYRWEDVAILPKSSGKDVVDTISDMQNRHGVGNSNVIYDADGVGAFIGGDNNGFIEGAIAFHNGAKQIETEDKRKFKNLKTQCFIYSGERCSRSESYISEKVANTMFDEKMTVRQRILYERKAIKKMPKKDEEAERLIKKEEMKQKYLNGSSPDLMDNFMMNEYFDIMIRSTVIEAQANADDLGLF